MGGIRDGLWRGRTIGPMTPNTTPDPRYAAVTAPNGQTVALINLDRAKLLPFVSGGEGETPPAAPTPPVQPVATLSQADLDAAVAAASEQARADAIKQLGFDKPEDAAAAVKAYNDSLDANRTELERAQAEAAANAAAAADAQARVAQYERRDQIAAAIGDARFIPNVEAAVVGELNEANLAAAVAAVKAQFPHDFPAVDADGNLVQPPPPVVPHRPVGVAGTGAGAAPRTVAQPGTSVADRMKAGFDKFAKSHPDRVKQDA